MPETFFQSHKKLSQVIFEWQASDKAALLAQFMMIEVATHWLWCLFVWIKRDDYGDYIQMELLQPVWLGVTVIGLLFYGLMKHFATIKDDRSLLYRWQLLLIVAYSFYIAVMILVMGYSSLVSGVSLVGGAMLGMMLVRRRYMWWAFLWQVLLIVMVTMIPYLGVKLPDLRQLTITSLPLDTYSYLTYSETATLENAIAASIFKDGKISWDNVEHLRQSSTFFWRSTHLYLALPKAIFMVFMFRTLLIILDNSRNEILDHANKDELTRLDNRRFGLTQIQSMLMGLESDQYYSVILLDLDWFKNVNDSHGHEAGDQVLREVATILTETFQGRAVVSRYGGEEFLIGLPSVGHDRAVEIAEALRVKIANHQVCIEDGSAFFITASLGVYSVSDNDLSLLKSRCQTAAGGAASLKPAPLHSKNEKAAAWSKPDLVKSAPKSTAKTLPKTLKLAAALHKKRQPQHLNQLSSDVCQRVISTADKALYYAKNNGRNRVVSANLLIDSETISL